MIGMMSAAFTYNNHISVNRYYRSPFPTTSTTFRSPTLVNKVPVHRIERRPSLKLSFPSGASNILNSAVIHAAGRSFYSISSNSRRTTILSCRGNVKVAIVQWDRHSPRMVFCHKNMKCKKWLKLAEPNNEYIPVSPYLPESDS